jgi:hypothetical protein
MKFLRKVQDCRTPSDHGREGQPLPTALVLNSNLLIISGLNGIIPRLPGDDAMISANLALGISPAPRCYG